MAMSFVTVKFADNQCRVFNPNCKNEVLLSCIKQQCGINPDESIDVSDEKGYVKQLHYNPDDYGTEYLRDRENLVLLKVNRMMSEEDLAAVADDDVTYTPLLNALADDIQFLGQLNPRSTKSSKRRMATRRSLSQTNNQAKGKSKIK